VSASVTASVARSSSLPATCSSRAAVADASLSRSLRPSCSSTRSSPPAGACRSSPVAANSTRPRTRHGHAAEAVGEPVERLDQPGVRQRSAQVASHGRGRLDVVEQRLGAGRWGRSRGGGTPLRCGQEGAAALRSGRVEERVALAQVGHDSRSQQRTQRGCDRQLVARLRPDVLSERSGARGRRAGRAQEVVHGGELRADACRLATGRLHGPLGRAAGFTRLAGGALGGVQLLPPELGRGNDLVAACLGGVLLGAQPLQLGLDPGRPLGFELRERLLELRYPLGRPPFRFRLGCGLVALRALHVRDQVELPAAARRILRGSGAEVARPARGAARSAPRRSAPRTGGW